MLRNALYGVVLTIAVAGCSSLPMMTKEEPDTTPQNPTAVLETHVVSEGIKGFLPFEGTNKIYTRADMHAVRSAMHMLFDSTQPDFAARIATIEARFAASEPVRKVLAFVVEHDAAAHHVGAQRPAGVAVHGNVQSVGEAAAEVPDVAAEADGGARVVEESHRQAVPRARVQHVHRSGSAVQQLPQALVDLARAEAVRVQRGRR